MCICMQICLMNESFAAYQPYIFLTAGLISLTISVFWNSKKNELQETGIPADGIIFEQDFENSINFSTKDSYSSPIKDKIIVRFLTQKQEWITGAIKQDFQFFYTGQYKDGDAVKVYYDKDNPSNFYVETKQSELTGRLVVGAAGLIFIIVALYQIFIA